MDLREKLPLRDIAVGYKQLLEIEPARTRSDSQTVNSPSTTGSKNASAPTSCCAG
jgi:hypothetical protein